MTAICIPAAIPPELNAINDEHKAIYHSADCICIWVFVTRKSETASWKRQGMANG